MILSLKRYLPNSKIIVLCIDEESKNRLDKLKLKNVHAKFINDILDKKILSLKEDRTLAEFCWTLTPIALEIGLNLSEDGKITYLDADLYFFKSPHVLLEKIRSSHKSITITPHDFSSHLKDLIIFGKFCVQWITIYDNKIGRECIKKYKKQCLEWCYAFIDNNRFGDQKYLDSWPEEYKDDILILEPKIGFGAPWNMSSNQISFDKNKGYLIKNCDLIFFHFHQFKIFKNQKFFWCSRSYGYKNSGLKKMYKTYESAIISSKKILGSQYLSDLEKETWITFKFKRAFKDLLPLSFRNFLKRILTQSINK